MIKTLKISFVLMLFNVFTGLQAQESLTTAGGNAIGSGGSVSYSIGQVLYTTNIGPDGSSAQGVQQPYEISVVTAKEETDEIVLIVSAYPNPTTDILMLSINSASLYSFGSLSYQLYDFNGKLLEDKRIDGTETIIDMSHHPLATYLLSIFESRSVIKTFKIIKS